MTGIKIAVFVMCVVLFFIGGWKWHNARRFMMPVLLTIAGVFFSHMCWWALSMISVVGIFITGYGEKSIWRKIFGDGWGRGVWGLLAGLCLSTGLLIAGHLPWYFFLGYLGLSFTLENLLKRIPQVIGDPIIGAAFASIIFLIH